MSDPLGLFEEDTQGDPLGLFAVDKPSRKLVSEKGVLGDLAEGALGSVRALGDMVAGAGKIPVQAAAAIMGKVARPDLNLNELWKASGESLEGYVPSFGAQDTSGAYEAAMKPFELLGRAQEWVGDKAGELTGSPEVAGAVKIGSNFLPIPLVRPTVKAYNKLTGKDRLAPPRVEVEPPVAPKADPLGLFEKTNESEQFPLFDQDAQGRIANPYEAKLGDWRVDENGIPIKADLSMDVQRAQEPLQRGLWGDELPPSVDPIGVAATLDEGVKQFEEQPSQGGLPLTQAMDIMDPAERSKAIQEQLTGEVEAPGALDGALLEANSDFPAPNNINSGMRRGQGGGLDFSAFTDLFNRKTVSESGTLPTEGLTASTKPQKDTVVTPRSPEMLTAKQEKANKAALLGIKDTAYSRVSTREEALAGIDSKIDMTRVGANSLRSGSEGAARTNTKNKPLNYVRNVFQEARNNAEKLSKQYVTAPKTGVVAQVRRLSKDEKVGLADMLQELSRKQMELTPEVAKQLGMTDAQYKAGRAVRDALDARYASASDSLMSMGFEPFKARAGYMPSNFGGAYTSFVGHYTKDGRFVTTGIAQADTALGLKEAVKKYQSMGDKYAVELKQPKRKLKTSSGLRNNAYDGFNDLVNNLAKSDESFAKAKAMVDQHTADQVRALYRFDVHELEKRGVKGAYGDRPWLTRQKNADEFFTSVVDYLEEGFKYDSMQKPLNEALALVNDPKLASEMPNTKKFIESYTDKVQGRDLNPVGAVSNYMANLATDAVGVSPNYASRLTQGLASVSTSLMMGMGNLGFALMQMTQPFTSGMPEALALRSSLKLDPIEATKSMATALPNLVLMWFGGDKFVPPHMREAYKWAHEVGMFDFNEALLAKQIHESKLKTGAKAVINSTITVPEKLTRPPMFMAFYDMFYKAGFRGEDALLRAQEATDYSMVNYTPDERPGLYSAMGSMGQMLGALTTFKHNFIEQGVSRTLNAKKNPAAALYMVGLVFGLYGLSGIPGYEELSWLSEKITDKSAREWVLEDPTKSDVVMDGFASWQSDLDIQRRLSQSSLLPDTVVGAAPHLSNTWRILDAAYQYALNPDTANERKAISAALPTSARNVYEAEALTDQHGNVYKPDGTLRTETPRSNTESLIRKTVGVRPLRERLQDESLWTQHQRKMKQDQQLKDLSKKFEAAVINGDKVDGVLAAYAELGGDPSTLLNRVETIMQEAHMTPKQRAQGVPTDSPASVRRYNAYQP